MEKIKLSLLGVVLTLGSLSVAWAGIDGSISGSVTDSIGVAVPNVQIKLFTQDGRVLNTKNSSATGDYQFFPVTFGDYTLVVESPDFSPYKTTLHVSSGANSAVDIHLDPKESGKEMVLEVKAKRHLVKSSTATSSTEISKEQIKELPQGDEISLPKLLTTTTPGVVAGPFGQMFFRGNHANIQYQIDGIQLPDSPSNTFGDAFSPRNIDHMEVITGGIPAEYGERLASVVNIVTKSGPETPGGNAEVNYGSYNTTSPHLLYGGSNSSGSLHYFVSGNYNRTDRGLDTPQPLSDGGASGTDGLNQKQGGTQAVHDQASGNGEFAKLDWIADNDDKFTFIGFNSMSNFQIPNYPSSFAPTDAFFQAGFTDQFKNNNGTAPVFTWSPANTNDTQAEQNTYVESVWKHTISEKSFFQLAPYWKYSRIHVGNDPANDLASGTSGPYFINGATPSTFYENRDVNNFGLKGDFTTHPNDWNLVKAGFQAQWSRSSGKITVQTTDGSGTLTPLSTDTSPDTGTTESAYVQDDVTIFKWLILNAGVRFDATQFSFADAKPTDYAIQPRVGLNIMATDTTKIHLFYGKLFMPAPVEDLRDTFIGTGTGQLAPYNIKAEKDDYYEVGIAQQVFDKQVVSVNTYYKSAKNMLDDAQLLNTSIAQPYNFTKGYAEGIELSVKGQIADHWSEYVNYSYEIAKGQGISGGLFAFPAGTPTNTSYQYLDHVQVHTANAGLTYARTYYWATAEELFGSGLRTGPNNGRSLPSHFSTDLTFGYEFHGQSWWSKAKLSADALNIFNNVYPITVANGFNGSHYAAGREFFLRLEKDF